MSGGNGTTPLTIALTGNVTTVVVQNLIRNITYANTVTAPSIGRRYLRFTLLDETAKESNRETMQVAFTNQQGPVWVTGIQVNDGSIQALACHFLDRAIQPGDPRTWSQRIFINRPRLARRQCGMESRYDAGNFDIHRPVAGS